ncbi:TPA: hypothetical protein P0E33_005080 [Vibrio harveyi]|nr:hypothetical protein [Vibrio harveyi]HDM8183091.1 hypothetical protein [Vibrio harveyi]
MQEIKKELENIKLSISDISDEKEKIKDLENRIASLESGKAKPLTIFFQYLLAPLLVGALGWYFTGEIEDGKAELKQLELANVMLPKIFSEDTYVSLASHEILKSTLDNESLKVSINKIVKDHIEEKLRLASNEDKNNKVKEIVESVKQFDPDEELINLSKYQEAMKYEKEGFVALTEKEYDKAIKLFKKVETVYPSFHQVYEISDLLENNRDSLNNDETWNKVLYLIVNTMSWKAPEPELSILREQLGDYR